jgi:hypothetical protein
MIGVGSLTRGALGTSIALIIGTTAICLEVLALGALDWAWERPSGNVWRNLWPWSCWVVWYNLFVALLSLLLAVPFRDDYVKGAVSLGFWSSGSILEVFFFERLPLVKPLLVDVSTKPTSATTNLVQSIEAGAVIWHAPAYFIKRLALGTAETSNDNTVSRLC